MRMTIAEGMEWGVALPVFGALRVLAAVELDNQALLTTNAPPVPRPIAGEGRVGGRSIGVWRANLKPPSRRPRMLVHNVNPAGVSACCSDRARSTQF